MKTNLNKLKIVDADSGEDMQLADPSCKVGTIHAVFRNIVPTLLEEIRKAEYVFGCVAWLTHHQILSALAEKKGVSIIVQKEDFLRPDSVKASKTLQQLYRNMRSPNRFEFGDCNHSHEASPTFWTDGRENIFNIARLSTNGDNSTEAVRCVGNHNKHRNPAFPRAHHKFVVFARRAEPQRCLHNLARERALRVAPGESYTDYHHRVTLHPGKLESTWDECCAPTFQPYAVWTGSFNFTHNAEMSLENAVIISDEKIARAFFNEFQQVAALSEPLDWESEWSAPEWRIGT